jgi:hypothetical protein
MGQGMNLLKSAWESGSLVFRRRSNGTAVLTLAPGGVTLPTLRLGSAGAATIVSGVLTIPANTSYVVVTSETGTSDQVDSIAYASGSPADGDILVLVPKSTDTITYDDANIDLAGSGSRAIAPGGALVLIYNAAAANAASWQELVFLAASDNV